MTKPKPVFHGTDYTGKKFGALQAVKPTSRTNRWGARIWVFRCQCGNEIEESVSRLKVKNPSCGCLKNSADTAEKAISVSREWLARPIVGVFS